ncbi:hypothetical protein HXX76_005370 [Chlamydomonas incerta]|uniref:Uncharacterized protein n=1 Tax=Chlamydomonas incerta TaxID=51695 RepID=A0A835TEC7_CHLIN|nr:hypothetical protein HXX76_005370 [Chlamydomonas incerta]|eukprot:KAG2438829.1 hypothetical protein HXX76_005370 [Chlamydomonas incerta]
MASVLRIEVDELKNAIQHLERSNRELKELLASDPDPEYRQAIGENIVTVAKKRARVAALEEELRRITGEDPAAGEAVEPEAVPVEEDGSEAGGPGPQAQAMDVDGAGGATAGAGAAAAGAPAAAAAGTGTGQGGSTSTREGGKAAGESEGVWL